MVKTPLQQQMRISHKGKQYYLQKCSDSCTKLCSHRGFINGGKFLSKHIGINLLNVGKNLLQSGRIAGRFCLQQKKYNHVWNNKETRQKCQKALKEA
uniref:Uncharacterized protein n=1 Tax=Rhizophora mucronata TaxID=61149 RepID=A0A2P2KAV3_RHIMU